LVTVEGALNKSNQPGITRGLGFHRLGQLVEAFGVFLRPDRLRRRLLRGFKRPPGLGLDEVLPAGNFRERLPEVKHLLVLLPLVINRLLRLLRLLLLLLAPLQGLPLTGGEAALYRRTIIAPGGTVQALPVGQAGSRNAGGAVKAARAEVDVGAADARRQGDAAAAQAQLKLWQNADAPAEAKTHDESIVR